MKFLVLTQSDGKRRVSEHDCPSFDDLHSKLAATGVTDYRAYCEISDLVKTLSQRVAALERQLDSSDTSSPSNSDYTAIVAPNKPQRKDRPASQLIKVELVNKYFVPENYDLGVHEDRIDFELRFHNISKDKIRAVKGDLVFCDLFDDEIFRIGITMNDPVAPGDFSTWSGGFPYNEFDREHAHFVGFKTEDLQVHLEKEKCVT